MPAPTRTAVLDLDLTPDRPPLLHVDASGDPPGWAARHRDVLRDVVNQHGAVLVRGLGLRDVASAAAVVGLLSDDLMAEREAFAPRQALGGGVHSATPWPSNQPMCMHHELSYARNFPGLLLFACLRAAGQGGATGVADAASVLAELPPELVKRFERQGWVLARTYNDEIGASYAEAFGTDDRAEVDRYCRANGISVDWQPDGGLRTRQRRRAVVRHPVTGVRCWFNQVAFLNEWTLDPDIREFLVDAYGRDGLPFTTLYGDGEPIGEDVVRLLNDVYTAQTRSEPWCDGDLLLVDNVRSAHSREAFTGQREVVVGLADPHHVAKGSPTVQRGAQ